MAYISRRMLIGGSLWAGLRPGLVAQGGGALTAAQVIAKIRENVGVAWAEQTVDKVVGGSPEVVVKGVATTMMATFDVVQRAAKAGLNLVITHEPTFYAHLDDGAQLQQDATYLLKQDFLAKNQMAVFRFHDHWHRRRPDGIATGMMRELGWEKLMDPDNRRLFRFEGMTLAKLALHIESRLGAKTVRVVGDPGLTVKAAMANWGYASQFPGIANLARPEVDVLIVGEAREWEIVEYAQDLVASGQKKGLIVIGHVASEQAGMKYCAEWLSGFLPGLPVRFVAAGEPFWYPGA